MNRHTSNPFLAGWEEKDNDGGAEVTAAYKKDASIIDDDQPQTDESKNTTQKSDADGNNNVTAPNPFNSQRSADRRLYHRNMSSFEAASLQLEQQQQLQGKGGGAHEQVDSDQTELIARMTADFQTAMETNDKCFALDDEACTFDPFETIVDDDVSLPSPVANTTTTEMEQKFTSAAKKPHDSIDEDEQELVSTPVRNIKYSPQNVQPDQQQPQARDVQDPFETVVDEEICANRLTDGENPIDGVYSTTTTTTTTTTVKNNEIKEEDPEKEQTSSSVKSVTSSAQKDDGDSTEQRTSNANPSPSPFQDPTALKLQTPAKKKSKPKKKPSVQRDSSDSSDDDDRIQIVIKARNPDQSENRTSSTFMPLLPPPPSKNSMKQARERGQVEDMPSPVMSYKSRNREKKEPHARDSFDDSDDEQDQVDHKEQQKEKLASEEGVRAQTTGTLGEKMGEVKKLDNEEEESDHDHDNGAFVIPMTLPSDEEVDAYGKPETPLYDEDTSYVLEDFPAKYEGPGWEMMLRYPPKKKLTSNRFWKKIFVKLAQVPLTSGGNKAKEDPTKKDLPQQTCIALQIFDKPDDKKPMQEIPIQATYTVSEISNQQYDQFGKIFTLKLQYIFYKERVGVRQGQLARFIHSGHIGSSTTSGGHGADPISVGAIKRLGAPIEHSPQVSQIIKLGCTSYSEIKQFKNCLEDYLFKMPITRERALSTYRTEEVQMAVRDETYIELNQVGTIIKQMARVRLFFLSFLNGTPTVEVGINDIGRQGKEVVGRMDILPVVTEEWIRLEACELHSTVNKEDFENPETQIVKLTPPDATFFELMRFRIRPPRNRELPLQISANMSVTRTRVTINCEVMVPGCVSRKHGQIPCEAIAIKVFIPECWIYFFREEKHFRMGSKKSVNRRPGKVKGIERFLGGGGLQDLNDESSLIEVTSGQAKYEHHHNSIVWRAARWPKETQSAYVQNTMKIRLPLTAFDKMPENFYEYVHVEYTMPATTVSHTTLRSISVNPCDDEPPEKYVKYSAKYEYKVRMRLSVNLSSKTADQQPESSPIVIMKQPDLQGDLQREEDSDDDDEDHDEVSHDGSSEN